ncbi:MAG TPA: TonB-dependent receptor, partial [Pseudomonadales bacterium]|nr:TonB-dependent receptor [Pseudomonadales bacterium]
MMRNTRITLLSISACSLSLAPVAVAAAEQPSDHTLDTVVVTASKSGEVSAQNLPAAISVFSADKLQEGNFQSLEDLKGLTPGFAISRNGSAARLYLRGIGTNLDFIGSDPSVAVQVDGVYQARGYTLLDNLVNVARVEVLRGPQGTLYGRNSTGGTINIITQLPDASPQAKASVSAGNFASRVVSASASGGLGSDQVIGSLALMKSGHDPYVENDNPAGIDGLVDDDSRRAAGSLRTQLGQQGELIFRADYAHQDGTPAAYKTTGLGLTGAPVPISALLKIPANPFHTHISLTDPFRNQTSSGESAELNWQFAPSWSLTSLTAYRHLSFNGQEDTDGSNLNALVTQLDEAQNQWSEEFRVNYKKADISWVTGVFLFREQHDSDAAINILATRQRTHYVASNETNANALFSQATFALSKKLNGTLGVRASEEKKQFQNLNSVINTVSAAQI